MLKGEQTLTNCPQCLHSTGCSKLKFLEEKTIHSSPTYCISVSTRTSIKTIVVRDCKLRGLTIPSIEDWFVGQPMLF